MALRVRVFAMKFPCVQCGVCCRMVTSIAGFSDFDGGGGVCRYLNGNLCDIYETRPLFCDSERVYATFFKDSMTESEFIEKTLDLCLGLIQQYGDSQAIARIKNVIKNRESEKIVKGE